MNDITRFRAALDAATSSKRVRLPSGLALVAGCLVLIGCGAENQGEESSASDPLALEFERFEQAAPRERGTGAYLVEGDMPLWSRAELRQYFDAIHGQIGQQPRAAMRVEGLGETSDPLAVRNVSGVDDRWPASLQNSITYCVSFDFQDNYGSVASAMFRAASAWRDAANINFVYVPNQDRACNANNTSVVFNVSPTSGQDYHARAFFPSSVRSARNVLVNTKAFTDPRYTLTGILRHELGHALGFRHEHTTGSTKSGCYEDRNWRPLTDYDSASVMQYPDCAGTAGDALLLTALDRTGAACLYGPASGFFPDCTYHGLSYSAHAGGIGWLPNVKSGNIAGTIGEGRRLEAFKLATTGASFGVCYSAYVQGTGWLPEVCNDEIAGTTGAGKRLEAVKIRVSASPLTCSINYQAHVSGIGWQSVVANNAVAGTTGQSRAIEALKIWTSGNCGF